jgi:hypothetical protein
MIFVEHPTFTAQITELLSDDQYKDLQNSLVENPLQKRRVRQLVEEIKAEYKP